MFLSQKDYVFVSMNEGIGKNTQKPYRFIKLADPDTFENFQLNADPTKVFIPLTAGEKIRPAIKLSEAFNRIQVEVVDIKSAVLAK